MVKLLVLADDFTGSLDTGVQFRARGTRIRFGSPNNRYFEHLEEDVQVLIVDTESRHLPPEEAAAVVRQVVSDAVAHGVRYIYKKTDSGLRGNIGAELSAALEASGKSALHFIPAFPQIGRTTKDGIHYINGIPVGKSVFANDPFNPVLHSRVKDIIACQSDVPVFTAGKALPQQGIMIHDAESEAELAVIAAELKSADRLSLLAGCAGFASVLPELLELETEESVIPRFTPRLLTLCGSINPITLEQLAAAEAAGVPHIRLTTRQKLDNCWIDTEEGQQIIAQWAEMIATHPSTVINCDGTNDPDGLKALQQELGLSFEQMRCRIAETMGRILKALLDNGINATLLLTGGDTLLASMNRLGQEELIPIREISQGVVLSRIRYRNKTYDLLSKSGGFGTSDLLAQLQEIICK
jgi:uncharacterized protein YgbK (DUF1537 family)